MQVDGWVGVAEVIFLFGLSWEGIQMRKYKLFKGVCLVTAMITLPASQAVMAEGEVTWDISGWINEGMTYWDDGDDSNVNQLSDNGTTLGSRITLSGGYKPPETNLDAGFEVIIEPLSGVQNFAGGGSVTPLLFANQDNIDTFNGGDIGLLSSNVHIGGPWGKVTVGLQSMPTDNIAVLADPSGTIWSGISPVFRGNGFFIRGIGAGASNTTWGEFLQCLTTPALGIGMDCNGVYRNGLRYDLPAFGDLSAAVGYSNDNIYDIALKYDTNFGNFKTMLHGGYAHNSNGGSNVGGDKSQIFQVQGGVLHSETGLFGVLTYQYEKANSAASGSGDDTDAYYVKAGIKKRWFDFGDTSLYGEFGYYKDQYGAGNVDGISGSDVQRIGVSAVQEFGDRLRIYAKLENLSLDVDGNATAKAIYDGADDLNTFTTAVTYFF